MDTTLQRYDASLRDAAREAVTRYAGEDGRINRGLVLALNSCVDLGADGTAWVCSQSDEEVKYFVHAGMCECIDWHNAPDHRCKHRWAVHLARVAQAALDLIGQGA